jgi:predicted dienelactone hydrolase
LLFYNSCCEDPRVKAVVAVSGILFPSKRGNYDDPPTIPLLMLHGEEDSTLAYDAGSKRIFDQFAAVPRALVSFPDAGHVDLLGKPGFAESMIAFLNLELRDDPTDWHKLSAQLDTFGTATIEVGGGLEPPT